MWRDQERRREGGRRRGSSCPAQQRPVAALIPPPPNAPAHSPRRRPAHSPLQGPVYCQQSGRPALPWKQTARRRPAGRRRPRLPSRRRGRVHGGRAAGCQHCSGAAAVTRSSRRSGGVAVRHAAFRSVAAVPWHLAPRRASRRPAALHAAPVLCCGPAALLSEERRERIHPSLAAICSLNASESKGLLPAALGARLGRNHVISGRLPRCGSTQQKGEGVDSREEVGRLGQPFSVDRVLLFPKECS